MDKIIIGFVCISILGIILAINIAPSSKILLTIIVFGMFGSALFGDDNANSSNIAPPPHRRPPASLAARQVAAINSSIVPPIISPELQHEQALQAAANKRFDEKLKPKMSKKQLAAMTTVTAAWMLLYTSITHNFI